MHRRNRNIILFFEENENAGSISSKMVRLYMNRFIIEEEQRFEITGVFNLAKVPKITAEIGDRPLRNISMRNWNEDRQLIKGAFEKLEIFTLLSTDIHLFMGTSLYLDAMNNNDSLEELVRNLRKKCSSSTSISMTLLNGQKHDLHPKNVVQNLYKYQEGWAFRFRFSQKFFNVYGQRFFLDFLSSRSLNDDLEKFYAAVAHKDTRWQSIERIFFLFEMQSEDDIKSKPDLIKLSDDHQYLLSLCKAITVHLK